MRNKIVAALALGLGVLLLLTFALSMVRPDLTGGRSFVALLAALPLLAFWTGSRKKRVGASPPPDARPGP